MTAFNKDQMNAINAENKRLLVSAAAGSGKTTVMVERIKNILITHPEKHLSDMLIITFTREAAASMRRKLQTSLSNEASLGNKAAAAALNEIEATQISTIHSFCTQVIRNGFQLAGIDPLFRVAEESELPPLFEKAYYAAVERLIGADSTASAEEKKKVTDFLQSFSQDEILSSCDNLYKALMGIPKPFDRLHHYVQQSRLSPASSPWTSEIIESVNLDLHTIAGLIEQEQDLVKHPDAHEKCIMAVAEDKQIVENMLKHVLSSKSVEDISRHIENARRAFPNIVLRNLSDAQKVWYEQFKEIRALYKGSTGILGKVSKSLDPILNCDMRYVNYTADELEGLEILMRAIADCFREEKAKENLIDYSDMEQMTYQIMTDDDNNDVRDGMLYRYTDIFVDECQDVSAIQDAIIQSLHHPQNSLFMVGDIKQSIYRFRHAEPKLFQGYRDAYSLDENADERKIYFRDNYRSSSEIIACVNAVFERAMARCVTELDYEEGDRLVANKIGTNAPVDVILVNRESTTDDDDSTDDMLEAQCVEAAKKINELISMPASENMPKYQYRDICILIRSAKNEATRMVDAFKRLHVPVFFDGAQNFYALTEITTFVSLLDIIDNIRQDVPLITALRNVPFEFTDENLADIKIAFPSTASFYDAFKACSEADTPLGRKCKAVLDKVSEWRYMASKMPVADFVWLLLRDSSYYYSFGSYPDGQMRQSNLDMLHQKALDLSRRGVVTLSDYLRKIHAVSDTNRKDSDAPSSLGTNDNFVRLMTMHKSKGLEFRAVILMNLGKNFIYRPGKREILRMDVSNDSADKPSLGLYLPAINAKKRTINKTFGSNAFDVREKRNEIAEQSRLLYVAMTRAMEKLILIGTYRQKDVTRWLITDQVSRIWQSCSMIDMIMPAVLSAVQIPKTGVSVCGGDWTLTVAAPKKITDTVDTTVSEELDKQIAEGATSDPKKFAKLWEQEDRQIIPPKTAVTTLVTHGLVKPVITDEETVGDTAASKRIDLEDSASFRLAPEPTRPLFLEDTKPAPTDIGSAAHRFLRLVNLKAFRDADKADYESIVKQEIDRMSRSRILQPIQADMLNSREIATLLSGKIGQALINSAYVRREWSFTMRVTENGRALVQGVIDAAIRKDDKTWALIDYKTDRDTFPGRFVARHKAQMNWYRVALEELTGMPVSEMWLYAIRAGKAFRVKPEKVSA